MWLFRHSRCCIESLDGAPLIENIHEIWTNFPYERIPPDSNTILVLFLRPYTVILSIGFYLIVSKPLFQRLRQALQSIQHYYSFDYDTILRVFVAMHNFVLAVFSFVVAVGSWQAVITQAMQYGLGAAIYCDNTDLWKRFGPWAVIFYLSKYYEFVDTWILVLKGKDASFLQVYHHTGIAIIMWCAILSQSAWLIFVVLLNSVIHTLMYTYFFLKTIAPDLQIKSAKYLTMAQIIQFLIGIACTLGVFYWGDSCASQSSRFALALLHGYGYGLVGLFFAFAKRKYKES